MADVPTPRRKRFDLFRLLLILIPCLMFCYELVGYSQFAGWDITRLNLPLKWYDVQSVRAGVLPLWNQYLYAGMPQLAESESGLFYLGNLLMYLPGSFFYWAGLTYILHFILAGLFCDLWLRGRGVDARTSFMGSVLFQTSPFLMFHISSMALMQAAVWFPLLLWLADRIVESTDSRRAGLLDGWASLLAGMLIFVGNIQIVFYEFLLLGFYLLGHVFSSKEGRGRRLGRSVGLLSAMLVIGGLIGAVIWMPALEFARTTVREDTGGGFYNLGTWLTPSRLASAFYFPAYGRQTEMVHWASSLIYVGLLPSIMVLLRIMGIRVNWRRDAPLIVMGGVALFLAFGMNNPVNHALAKIPPFSMFRYQGRFALGGLVGLIGLAAAWMSDRMSVIVPPTVPSNTSASFNGGTADNTSPPLAGGIKGGGIIGALAIVFISLFSFLLYAAHSKAILWGGFVLLADIALTWWAIASMMQGTGTRSGRRRLSFTTSASVRRPDRVPVPVWLVAYVLFHLILVFPIGRLATMPVAKFQQALSFFDHLRRGELRSPVQSAGSPGSPAFLDHHKRFDGLLYRLLVIDVGRFADRDLLAFSKFTPQDNLPNLYAGNTSVFRGVQTMDPYTPLQPKEWAQIIADNIAAGFATAGQADGALDQGNANLLRALGVDYVVTSGGVEHIPGYTDAGAVLDMAVGPNAKIFMSEQEDPRIWRVEDRGIEPRSNPNPTDPQPVIDLLKTGTWDAVWYPSYEANPPPGTAVSVETLQGIRVGRRDAQTPSIIFTKFEPNEYTIAFTANTPGTYVLEVSYSPYWRVTLNGNPVDIERVNAVYCLIRIPSTGDQVIELSYEPPALDLGGTISIMGLVLAVGWLIIFRLRRKTRLDIRPEP